MEKQEIINKYKNDEDKLLVSKVLDKIKWTRTKNKISNTDFLDMYQKKVIDEVLKAERAKNFIYYYPCDNAEKPMLIIYSEKYDEILKNNKFDFSQFVKLIRIILPLTMQILNGFMPKHITSSITSPKRVTRMEPKKSLKNREILILSN